MPLVRTMSGTRASMAVYGPDVEPPEWYQASPPRQTVQRPTRQQRRQYYAILAAELWYNKQRELYLGLDAEGNPLAPVKSRRGRSPWHGRRYSRGTGPPLSPFGLTSRVRNLLRYRSDDRGAVLYWAPRKAPGGRLTWPEILIAHAEGRVQGAPVRDVIGLSPDGLIKAVNAAVRRWRTGSGPRKIDLPPSSRMNATPAERRRPEPDTGPSMIVRVFEAASRLVMRLWGRA